MARIQFPTVSVNAPVVVIPNTIVTSCNTIATPTQNIAAITTATLSLSGTDYIVRSTSPSNVIITEVTDDSQVHSANEVDTDDTDAESTRQFNRRNSMSAMNAKQGLTRQLSDGTKTNDSPSLPKRNQPITSSAPSTLNKAKPEEKAGEVFV